MRHDINLACINYRLRPVTLADAAFIVELRSDPVRTRFLHEISPRVEDQVSWLERYFERPGDYYFIIEDVDLAQPAGTIGIYDMSEDASHATWGRWITKPNPLAAMESVWLICEIAFSRLGLASVSSLTIVDNVPVISLHDRFGATRSALREGLYIVRGECKSAVEHTIRAGDWPTLRDKHYSTLLKIGRRTRQTA
jgi:RimJ/RimL family protein N-acetyltransferase